MKLILKVSQSCYYGTEVSPGPTVVPVASFIYYYLPTLLNLCYWNKETGTLPSHHNLPTTMCSMPALLVYSITIIMMLYRLSFLTTELQAAFIMARYLLMWMASVHQILLLTQFHHPLYVD